MGGGLGRLNHAPSIAIAKPAQEWLALGGANWAAVEIATATDSGCKLHAGALPLADHGANYATATDPVGNYMTLRQERYNNAMGNLLNRIPLIAGLALLVIGFILMFANFLELQRLATAASTLNRTFEDPTGRIFLTCFIFLGGGFFLGMAARSMGRRSTP